MSPAIKTESAEVQAESGGNVRIVRAGKDEVAITWVCGATRSYVPKELKAAVDRVEYMTLFEDAWLQDLDSRERRHTMRVKDGRFYADDNLHSAKQDADSVPWDEFRDALLAVAA